MRSTAGLQLFGFAARLTTQFGPNGETLAMQKWAESASQHNFQHKLFLMEAEYAYCNNDFDSATSYYKLAIATAKKHRFLNDEALACELAGHFCLDALEDNDSALQYFLQAHSKYHEWGAIAKANLLFESVLRRLSLSTTLPVDLNSAASSMDDLGISDESNRRKRGSGD